ncbi:DUF5908 family protein [Flavilitoribacter nigricans]|uniref:DUF5908 family protein n=1 Tax=Flavilitoribacter nigricans TaxID=70997 RepID=UPI001C9E55EA
MPIQIKELLVRTIVAPKPEPEKKKRNAGRLAIPDKQALITECVEQVIKQLNYQQER